MSSEQTREQEKTDAELVAEVRAGRRITNEFSLHTAEVPQGCMPYGFNHQWRVLVCADPDDVVECQRCGAQRIARCDFDEDFA